MGVHPEKEDVSNCVEDFQIIQSRTICSLTEDTVYLWDRLNGKSEPYHATNPVALFLALKSQNSFKTAL